MLIYLYINQFFNFVQDLKSICKMNKIAYIRFKIQFIIKLKIKA